jgi:hypothetical protein
MRVDDECGLACVVRAAGRRIDDVTLVSGAAPLRIALWRGVRCPFWDLSRLFLQPSGDLPVILSWDCFISPRTRHKPTRPKASRRYYARQRHAVAPCSLRSPGLAGGTPQALRVTMTAVASVARLLIRLWARRHTHHKFPRVGTKGVKTALAPADPADHAKAMGVMILCK